MINKIKNIRKVLRTVSHLKPIQVVYQLKYRLIPPKTLSEYAIQDFDFCKLHFFPLPKIEILKVHKDSFEFEFLNLSHGFQKTIDWNFQGLGKLWNYNLQYMDWLKQESLTTSDKNLLSKNLYDNLWSGSLPLEPYPASLRIMNGIRYLSTCDEADQELAKYIKAEVNFLTQRLEYHLLANHILENAFAVYMAGCFFREINWKKKGEMLLRQELNEQILDDGAHFELSPMYHQIIFLRVLELLAYEDSSSKLYSFVRIKAGKMLSWLKSMIFNNGSIPHFNDSTDGIALRSKELFEIASKLGLNEEIDIRLKDSGYRKFQNHNIELFLDINGIEPKYQPGHAHADTFNFSLNYNDCPIVVDPGISSYNIGSRRDLERSTFFHNTLTINGENSSEVWAGFRVGKRLQVSTIKDNPNHYIGTHNGYRQFGLTVQRELVLTKSEIGIIDQVFGKINPLNRIKVCIYFHPDVKIESVNKGEFRINNDLKLSFSSFKNLYVEDYDYCRGFNSFRKAKRIVVEIEGNALTTRFYTNL